jgi:spore cortex biosynthesis protein YabQ
MENYISDQLISFLRSALLGLMAGVVYDLLRAVRLRRARSRVLTHLLDAVYVLSALLVLFLFTLRQGDGELRLYMLLAIALGLSFYFLLLGGIFRPLWSFWVDVLISLLKILWKPAGFLLCCGKKFQIYIKKLFYFWCKYATMYK